MKLHHAHCLDELRKMKKHSVDSIVTDPPYGIGIKGGWDKNLPVPDIWKECLRVLKPGGFILAFSSARLYHNLARDMESAGFETQNMLAWIYSPGFPKGTNLSLEFDKQDGIPVPDDKFRNYLKNATKKSPHTIAQLEEMCGTTSMFGHYLGKSQPAYPTPEKWRILKKVLGLDDTYDGLFLKIEKMRQEFRPTKETRRAKGQFFRSLADEFERHEPRSEEAKKWAGWRIGKASLKPCIDPIYFGQKPPVRPITENVKLHGVGALNIEGCKTTDDDGRNRWPTNAMHDGSPEAVRYLDVGGKRGSLYLNKFCFHPKANIKERRKSGHPTTKPISLMRHLVRLVTPRGGLCLDPFAGSGTTGAAALMEGVDFIGMEKEKDYFEISRARIESLRLKQEADDAA